MTSQTKTCQNCKKEFIIEPEDFDFYQKIKVPPPTWCWECRLLRKILWRNDIILYKRPESQTGKTIFSMYSADAPVQVWEKERWLSDCWDPMSYGKTYDWNRSFFEQFRDLSRQIPWPNKSIINAVNSDYCNNASNIKNCYLTFGTGGAENCYYSFSLVDSKDVFNSAYLDKSEITNELFNSNHCYRAFFSLDCENSNDIWFCRDCIGVNSCFGCAGLRNKSYQIFNKQYTKEEYKNHIEGLDLGSYQKLIEMQEKVKEFWLKYPIKFFHGRHNVNCTGDYIYNSKNVKNSFHIGDGENLKYCLYLIWEKARDSYDHFRISYNSELIYECCVCGHNISNLKFCFDCYPALMNSDYCISCHSSFFLFGCIGLRNKQYCILNKQYTKEDYEKLVPKIIEHMNTMPYIDKKGRVYKYGEFFPSELSPFCYNETIAQEYFPLTKEQAIEQGYSWKDPEERNYKIQITNDKLPDNIKDVDDSIVGQVIECFHKGQCNEQCTEAFKIIEPELQFYKRMNLPLPRLCPNCRHYQRLKQRNPLKLWKRQCQCQGKNSVNGVYQNTIKHEHGESPCLNEFETSYASDRPEIVYCESCYLKEVV